MVSRLYVPMDISQGIRRSGEKEAKKDMEATGLLLGLYNEADDFILTSKMYELPSMMGHHSLKARLYRKLKIRANFFAIRSVISKARSHVRELKRMDLTPAIIYYHTHPEKNTDDVDVWSPGDLRGLSALVCLWYKNGIEVADLLHTVDTNEFFALNKNAESMPVVIF